MFVARMTGAAALLALSTGIAAAVPAPVERTANVRAGPGTGYPVVATLRRGTVVDVEGCTGGWCVVDWSGGQGYMARSVLALGDAPPAVAVVPGPTYYQGPSYYYDDYPGFDYPGYALAPGVAVDVGPRWRHRHWRGRWQDRPGRPGRPDWAGRPGGPGWAGRPPQPRPQPGMGAGPAGKSFGQVGRPGFGGGAAMGGRATVGGGAPAAAAPAPVAPLAGPAGKR
jgi:uncharacterized protein YraI